MPTPVEMPALGNTVAEWAGSRWWEAAGASYSPYSGQCVYQLDKPMIPAYHAAQEAAP